MEEVERHLLVYHGDGRGAQVWWRHQKNGWRWGQSLKEEDGEGGFPEIRFRSWDTCSIGGAGVLG
jgi:hypothetical protein